MNLVVLHPDFVSYNIVPVSVMDDAVAKIIHYIAHANKEDSQGTKFQDKLRELVLNNIFGIDSDQSAIQVAAF